MNCFRHYENEQNPSLVFMKKTLIRRSIFFQFPVLFFFNFRYNLLLRLRSIFKNKVVTRLVDLNIFKGSRHNKNCKAWRAEHFALSKLSYEGIYTHTSYIHTYTPTHTHTHTHTHIHTHTHSNRHAHGLVTVMNYEYED